MRFMTKVFALASLLGSVLLLSAAMNGALSVWGALCLLPAAAWLTGKLAFAALQPAAKTVRQGHAAARSTCPMRPAYSRQGAVGRRRPQSGAQLKVVPGGRGRRGPDGPWAA